MQREDAKGKEDPALGLALLIAGVALVVRSVVLLEFASAPWFNLAIVDEEAYDRLARQLLAGAGLDAGYFWQSLFYPFALSLAYHLGTVAAARRVQAILGVVTAVLTYLLGRRIGGNRTGTIAGLAVALHGPLIFSETQLVATGWEVFWGVSLLLSLLWMLDEPRLLRVTLYAAIGAASILTRATFLPFVAVATIYALMVTARRHPNRVQARWRALVTAAVFALVLLPIAWSNQRATGSFTFLPRSGSINLYIGNNLDVTSTLGIRPGQEWESFGRLPRRYGARTPKESEQFFMQRFRDYVWEHPGHFVFGLARKTVQFVGSTEIPRNVDLYEYRRYSRVLSLLTWKVKSFGFPFGVLFPLAVVGLVFAGKRVPPVVWLFLLLVPLAVILVFVTARYRMVIVPPLSVVAALGAEALYERARQRRFLPVLGVLASAVFVTCVPNPLAVRERDWGSEMLAFVAIQHVEKGQLEKAEPLLVAALQEDGNNVAAHTVLGMVRAAQRRLPEAESQFTTALQIDPEYADAHLNYASLLLMQGRTNEALSHYQRALAVDPENVLALNNVGVIHRKRGELEQAATMFRKAIALNPALAQSQVNLGNVLVQQGKPVEAVKHLAKAFETNPAGSTALALARLHLDPKQASVYDPSKAVRYAEHACNKTGMSDLESIETLFRAYQLQGRSKDAAELVDRCFTVAVSTGNATLGGGCQKLKQEL